MGAISEIKVPDIGDFKNVDVIEVLVKAGDAVGPEQSLITVESDKATMEIPSPTAGVVKELRVKTGDKVSEGTPILLLEADAGAQSAGAVQPKGTAQAGAATQQIAGDGDAEGARPASGAGGATPKLAQTRATAATPLEARPETRPAEASPAVKGPVAQPPSVSAGAPAPPSLGEAPEELPRAAALPHASPSVRKFARELGVNLSRVHGTGPKNRILQEDVQAFVKGAIGAGAAAPAGGVGGLALPPWPKVDFAKFGPVDVQPLPRIKRISGPNLARNWVMIPHVTNHDEADITELEAFRVQLNQEAEKSGTKVTLLAFLVKACVAALKRYPDLNASLDGENLVYKRYYHIGFAADTPNGLVVPVIRDADRKGVMDIARETAELAARAREGKLSAAEMQGGTFSISSLGGIGGTSFTPIINAPEVAILGVSKSVMKPVWNGSEFRPRLMLPLSLSYDHRVVDGAAGARFNAYLVQLLADMRRSLL